LVKSYSQNQHKDHHQTDRYCCSKIGHKTGAGGISAFYRLLEKDTLSEKNKGDPDDNENHSENEGNDPVSG
jgi:hypothetical protein